jgi:ribosomal subunit interface protein
VHLYVTGRHFELTEAIQSHVQRKLVRPVETHTTPHDVVRMEVQLYELSNREQRFGCHVFLQMPGHHDINIREEDTDLYEAIDLAEKRLVRSLIQDREKRLSHKRHSRPPKEMAFARSLK